MIHFWVNFSVSALLNFAINNKLFPTHLSTLPFVLIIIDSWSVKSFPYYVYHILVPWMWFLPLAQLICQLQYKNKFSLEYMTILKFCGVSRFWSSMRGYATASRYYERIRIPCTISFNYMVFFILRQIFFLLLQPQIPNLL